MIEKIATDVSDKLINSVASRDFDMLVGMKAHMEKMKQLLRLDSDEVKMIGIWGPSGIGKSTIARVLFNQHSHSFQLIIYMSNIKKDYPRPCFDRYSAQLQLQSKFLSLLFNQKDVTIHHLGVAPERLKDKKVLVVLDDVDQSAQLDALAKELWWFGRGSRIIITTQDKKILNAHGINHIYEVGFPHDNEALEIFCINAFGQKTPYDGFEYLAWEVTKLAGKLPLGLRVMGSYFKGLSKEEWEYELPRLATRLDGEIESILKFSYDALCDDDQALFLHIACFFKGECVVKVVEYLAQNIIGVKSRLRVLVEKSLISINQLGSIEMHDLLTRLGREIVRKQSPNQPGQRQFLVDAEDTYQVLRDDTQGSGSVIGINFKWDKELKIIDRAFERMSNVQFLRLYSSNHHPTPVRESLNYLPREVRLLHWIKFPMACLPSNFNPEFLVEINMRFSNLEKLWKGNKMIRNLKWMDLCNSINLKELPDLSTATNLRELKLHNCSSLVELPFSIGNLTNLEELDLTGCSSLMELHSSFGNMTNLEMLKLDDCSSLVQIPSSIGNMTNLAELKFTGCSSLVELPFSIRNLTNLEELDLTECSSLVELPSSIGNMTNFKELILDNCSSIMKLPSSTGNMANLKNLSLTGCSSLVELPSSIGNLTNLKNLPLMRCSSLVQIPSSIGNLANLKNLYLTHCSSLVQIPSSIGNMTNLAELKFTGCSSLVELPSSIGNLHNLKALSMKGCSKLKALPVNINMKSLDYVNLSHCSSLESFPEISTNIRILYLNGTAVEEIPPTIRSWSRLNTLEIKGCTKLVSLPQLPDSLKNIYAENCESLERLDCSFYNTEFLVLSFVNCFKLNQEARDLILKISTKRWAVFPGETLPTYFSYRATGSSLSMKLNELDTHLPTSMSFTACLLVVSKGDVGDFVGNLVVSKVALSGVEGNSGPTYIWFTDYPHSEKHLVIVEFEETVSSSILVFEFGLSNENWEIKECGIHPPESLASSC